jgi:hypothetical protein
VTQSAIPVIPAYARDYREPGQRERDIVDKVMKLFEQSNERRITFATQWEETAEILWPNQRNTFYKWNVNWPGMKKTDRQIDMSGMIALQRFAAIFDSLLTPANMQWHTLAASNEYVQKNRSVQIWMEQASRILFKERYKPTANFASNNHMIFKNLGAFGNAPMFVDQLVSPQGQKLPGLRYCALPVGQVFIWCNHQGQVIGFIRAWRLTGQQAVKQWPKKCGPKLWEAMLKGSQQLFDFFHCVMPNDEYEPLRLDAKGKRFQSVYIDASNRALLSESGYNSFPMPYGRYENAPEEDYARGVAQNILPTLKTLNAEKKVFLKTGHRAASPPLLTRDDGLVDFSLKPDVINSGGLDENGNYLIRPLESGGKIEITKEMMDEERGIVNDSFLVSLFQILTETPQMTATEVVERINEKGILIAPDVGRQQSEYLEPMIDRELDLLVEMKKLPPMPPLLREARGEYGVVYTSPLSKMMRAQEAAGFMRTVETALNIASQMQDPSVLDTFDFDTAIPEIAYIQGTPVSWTRSKEAIARIRKGRAQAQERQQQSQEAPGQAALMKAQAVASKEGLQPQQVIGGQQGQQQQ